MSRFLKITLAVFLGSMGFALQLVYAEGQEEYMRDGATQEDYINALKKTRSIRPVSAAESQASSATPEVQPASTGISIKVYFTYGSAELTPEAKDELDTLGAALASPDLSGERWGVEGHTDAAGSAGYNQSLSERRALSVQQYLSTKFGIDPNQLVPSGKGEEELYDTNNPYSGINRRVRIKYLGG